ncbi:MAG: tRNA (adenosine(37)-N6)-threonylcarbamoyltransferase complex dimerization subunit type 1 TsaB [Myxococcota bacterium]
MILALDTCGPVLGVACDERTRTERVTRGGETRLIPWALELAGGSLAGITAIAVAVGPGAFTGLRVGIATGQGLAEALGVPLFGFGSLESRARAAGCELALLDARKGRVYAGWARDGFAPADIAPEAAVAGAAPGFRATGEGALVYRAIVEAAGGVVVEHADQPGVAGLVLLAREALASGRSGDPAQVHPVYVRAPDAKPPRTGI